MANAYRYGFNGQEKDDEVSGSGNINTAMFWEYDTRLGRRWNLDPKPVTGYSDYSCFNNNPIVNIDILGDIVDHNSRRDKVNTNLGRMFNKEFRQNYRQLKNSDQLYVFNGSKVLSPNQTTGENGDVSYNENYKKSGTDAVMLNYQYGILPKYSGASKWRGTLYHETTHGVQLDNGDGGFIKVNGEWKTFNNDLTNEFNALNNELSYGNKNSTYNELQSALPGAGTYREGTSANLWQHSTLEQRKTLASGLYNQYGGVWINKVNSNTVIIKTNSLFARPYNSNTNDKTNSPVLLSDPPIIIPDPPKLNLPNNPNSIWGR